MEIWIVLLLLSTGSLSDEVYHRCLDQLDGTSQARVKRFYRREDSWRSLIGMLLPRAFLRKEGIPLSSVRFTRTEAGKPFIESPSLNLAVGYNVSHDNQMIGMVSHIGGKQDIQKIGIDVMRCALPKGETVSSFLRAIGDTLTQNELVAFTPILDTTIAIRHIFLLWTLKEAYTKALGLGLGFDFSRIEYNISQSRVTVDGEPSLGWEFLLFELQGLLEEGQLDVYQGAIARWVGGESTHMEFIHNIEKDPRFHVKGLADLVDGI